MHRYRQNILNKQSNTPNKKSNEDYGIGTFKHKFPHKELTKSKSHKDILIAKNKKLPEFFKIQNNHSNHHFQHFLINSKNNNTKPHPKLSLIESKKQAKAKEIQDDQYCLQNKKTSYFGNSIQLSKSTKIMQTQIKNRFVQQNLQSDRIDAKDLRQKLKKSTSMKNLIEQRFLFQTHQKNNTQKIQNNVYTGKTNEPLKQYDSSKYNWRLSRSKQKSREKSLSALQSKAKFICELNKNKANKEKLSLGISRENLNKKSIQTSNESNLTKKDQYNHQPGEKFIRNHQDKLAYTFGSDIVNSLNFQ